ncbi:MAG: hypothetical protein QXU32_04760 [Nitrososphaerales archaeon]
MEIGFKIDSDADEAIYRQKNEIADKPDEFVIGLHNFWFCNDHLRTQGRTGDTFKNLRKDRQGTARGNCAGYTRCI